MSSGKDRDAVRQMLKARMDAKRDGTDTYDLQAMCRTCGHVYARALTRVEAAFFEDRPVGLTCPSCGGAAQLKQLRMPAIDASLLEVWFQDPELSFSRQDEDITLSGTPLWILRETMGEDRGRQARLGPALAVKFSDARNMSEAELDWLGAFMEQNRDIWEGSVMDYIKQRVEARLAERDQ